MMAFCPEHPKWDQNPKFIPLSETTSIPTHFIFGVPPPVTGIPVRKFPACYKQKCTIGTGLVAIIADIEYLKFQIMYFIDSEPKL